MRLPDDAPVDYTVSMLGRFDPALILHARKRVAAAKEAWSAVAGGELHRFAGLSEAFSLVGDSLKRLFPHGETFGTELQHAVAQTLQSKAAPPAALAMEVATSLLYIEAALEDADFDDPEHAAACPPPCRAPERRAPEPSARAARRLDGGSLPPRLRSADDRQRGAGAARVAVRGRKARSTSSSAIRPIARC